MAQLNAYVGFNGNCREAMEFYKSIFGGELKFMTFETSGDTNPETKDRIMHSYLNTGKFEFMAADMMEGDVPAKSRISLAFIGEPDEVKNAYAKLSEGGTVGHELKEEFFGLYGDLTDKYGIAWMFQANTPNTNAPMTQG